MTSILNAEVVCSKAPTGKGFCFSCRRKITKGTPRIWYYDKMAKELNGIKGMNVKRLICHRCVIGILNWKINSAKNLLRTNLKIRRKFNRMLKGKLVKERILKEKILESLEEKQ